MVKRYFSGQVDAIRPLQSCIVESAVFNVPVRFHDGSGSGVVYWIGDELIQVFDPVLIEVDKEERAA